MKFFCRISLNKFGLLDHNNRAEMKRKSSTLLKSQSAKVRKLADSANQSLLEVTECIPMAIHIVLRWLMNSNGFKFSAKFK